MIRSRFILIQIQAICLALFVTGCTTSNRPAIPIATSPDPYTCHGLDFEDTVDTSDEYDWGKYAKSMLAEIKNNWIIPEPAKHGGQGRVRLRFVIAPDGNLACMDFVSRSGKQPLDVAAWNAVAGSQPLPSLPPDTPVIYGEAVTLTLYYNMKHEEQEQVKIAGKVSGNPVSTSPIAMLR